MSGQNDLRTGVLWKQILIFALPLAATSMLQQLFNAADLAIVGRFSGSEALAAVGATGAIVNLFVTFFSNITVGSNVLISRLIGARDDERARRAVHSTLILAVIVGLVGMLIGQILALPLLKAISTPADVLDQALLYIRIYIAGSVFISLYNFESAIMRANGDTKRPLVSLIISGLLNVVLNLIFVIVFHLSVIGVALATAISNAVGALILLIYMRREKSVIHVEWKMIRLDLRLTKEMLRFGIPAAIQGLMFTVANIIVQSGINVFGAAGIAGSTIALNAEYLSYFFMNSFGQACMTFNSQNYGAGNLDRCRSATRWSMILGCVSSEVFSILLCVFRYAFAGFHTLDPMIIEYAVIRMQIVLIFEVFNAVGEIMSGALRGRGYAVVPTVMSVLFVCVVRVFWITKVFSMIQTYELLVFVYPISWVGIALSTSVGYLIINRKRN